MSKLTKGEVTITLAGQERTLKPSLAAFSQLGSRYDNHFALMGKIIGGNVPAICAVLRYGLGLNDATAKPLPKQVMETGVHALVEPLADYVHRLFNNGLSVEELAAQQRDASEDGAGAEAEGDDAGNALLGG